MKRGKISLTLITTVLAVSVGTLSAESLSALRDRYHYSGQKTEAVKQKHRIQRHSKREERAGRLREKNIIKRKAAAKKAREQRRKLADAKRAQRRIDRRLGQKHAKRRDFRSLKEFRQRHSIAAQRQAKRVMRYSGRAHRGSLATEQSRHRADRRSYRWQDGRYDSRYVDYAHYQPWRPRHAQRGYRHTRRSWYLTYLYERASFYDRHGYKYGYFSRRGFMFEGEFYRYDRYYTYRDRLRGRGLFERRYYRPAYSRFGDLFAELERDGLYFYANFGF